MTHPRISGGVECHAVALTRNPTSRSGIAMPFCHSPASTAVAASMRCDMILFDHLAPDLRFLRNEGLRFGGRAAGGGEGDLAVEVLRLLAVVDVGGRRGE